MKKLLSFILGILLSSFLFNNVVFASVSCSQCQSDVCSCFLSDCGSGMVRIYDNGCSDVAKNIYVFSDGKVSLQSSQVNTNYAKVFCDNAQTSECARLISSPAATSTPQIPYNVILISFFLIAIVITAFFLFTKTQKQVPKKIRK